MLTESLLRAPNRVRHYQLARTAVCVSAPADVLAAVDRRLAVLASENDRQDDAIAFAFSSGGVCPIERPSEPLRAVYDPTDGEVLYAPTNDVLYLELGGLVRVQCKPVDGQTDIWIDEHHAADLWLLSHPVLTLPLIEMLKRRGRFSVHAAGVGRNHRALMLVGSSGAGKTTLAVALARAGLDFLGDDMLFLSVDPDRGGVQVHAFPDEVDVTESTAGFFPELRRLLTQPRAPGWPKWPVRLESMLDTSISWLNTPAAVVFPRVSAVTMSTLEAMSPDEALLELVPNVLLTAPAACSEHLAIMADLVRRTPCYRLYTGRDFDALPTLLGRLLE